MANLYKVDPKTIVDYGQCYEATALTLARVEAVGTTFVRLHFTTPQTFAGQDDLQNVVVVRVLIPRDAMNDMGATLLEELTDAATFSGPPTLRIVN